MKARLKTANTKIQERLPLETDRDEIDVKEKISGLTNVEPVPNVLDAGGGKLCTNEAEELTK